jgi:hypothetical protein
MLSRAIETLGRRVGTILARKNAGIVIAARPAILRRLNPIESDGFDRERLAVGRPAIRLRACGGSNHGEPHRVRRSPSRTRKPTHPEGPALRFSSANTQSARINRR